MQLPQIALALPMADTGLVPSVVPMAAEILVSFDAVMQDKPAAEAGDLPNRPDWPAILVATSLAMPVASQIPQLPNGPMAPIPAPDAMADEIMPSQAVAQLDYPAQDQSLPLGAPVFPREGGDEKSILDNDLRGAQRVDIPPDTGPAGPVAPKSTGSMPPALGFAQTTANDPTLATSAILPNPDLRQPAAPRNLPAINSLPGSEKRHDSGNAEKIVPARQAVASPTHTFQTDSPVAQPALVAEPAPLGKTLLPPVSSKEQAITPLPPVQEVRLAEAKGQGREVLPKALQSAAEPKLQTSKPPQDTEGRAALPDELPSILPLTGAAPPPHHTQTAPPQLHGIAQQIGQAIQQTLQTVQTAEGQRVELSLAPEELGKIQFDLATKGDSLKLVVFVERPETLELMRRHADQLLTDLRNAGFGQTSLEMGSWGQREQAQTAPIEPKATTPFSETLVAAMPQDQSAAAYDGRLHLRL